MYELAWQEIDRKGNIVSKRKVFKSSRARTAFVEKLLEKSSFYRTLGTCDPAWHGLKSKRREAQMPLDFPALWKDESHHALQGFQIKKEAYTMCIICVSPSGVRQPSVSTLRNMFSRNPHGAGYMVARDGKVVIHKGFMNITDYLRAIQQEHFAAKDRVVYHFRISTQAGVNPEMTHPFPLSNQPARMRALDQTCRCGIAHNGIIRLTVDPANTRYSDTAIFITDYLSSILRTRADLRNQDRIDRIYELAHSKFAIMDGSGYVATVGEFISDKGLLFSNGSYRAAEHPRLPNQIRKNPYTA